MERIMCAQKMKAMNGNGYALDERGLSIARELAWPTAVILLPTTRGRIGENFACGSGGD
jgi:hypothetical protein